MQVADREEFHSPQEGQTGKKTSASSEATRWIPALEARQILGIGTTRLAELLKGGQLPVGEETLERREDLLKQGILPYRLDPLDHRTHLVHQDDVQTLHQADQGVTIEQARQALGFSRKKMKAMLDEKTLPIRQSPLRRNRWLVVQEPYEALLLERQARPKKHTQTSS